MAKRFSRRRRRPTTWQNAPSGLSLARAETLVAANGLRNLVFSAGASGTLAAFPTALDIGYDDNTAAGVTWLTEGAVESRTLLRCVGMLRPVGILLSNDQGGGVLQVGGEVRYAMYRQTGGTPDEADFESTFGVYESPDQSEQPDLFSSSGMSNERIAWMRSFILPYNTGTAWSASDLKKLTDVVCQTLPWHKNAELSVLDWSGKRRVSLDSRFVLLRQVRIADTVSVPLSAAAQTCFLYDAAFARVLTSKR